MKAVFTKYIDAVAKHIDAGVSLKEVMDTVKPIYNKSSLEEQLELRSAIATLIGKKKKVTPITIEKGVYTGSLGFNAHGTAKEEQARAMLKYYMPTHVEKTSTTSSKQVDPIVQRANKLLSLIHI